MKIGMHGPSGLKKITKIQGKSIYKCTYKNGGADAGCRCRSADAWALVLGVGQPMLERWPGRRSADAWALVLVAGHRCLGAGLGAGCRCLVPVPGFGCRCLDVGPWCLTRELGPGRQRPVSVLLAW